MQVPGGIVNKTFLTALLILPQVTALLVYFDHFSENAAKKHCAVKFLVKFNLYTSTDDLYYVFSVGHSHSPFPVHPFPVS